MRLVHMMGFLAAWLVAAAPEPAHADDGATAKLYKARCATCHGARGDGKTTAGKKLGMKDWSDGKTLAQSDATIKKTIRDGVKGSDGKWRMAPFPKLTDDQLDALVDYIKKLAPKK